MACRTPSVDRVAEKFSDKLKGKLVELEKTLQDKDDSTKAEFFKRIESGLSDARIADARQLEYNSAIKTELTSEFNLDAIAGVITKALDTAIAVLKSPVSADALTAGVTSPLLTPAALESYKGLVTSVCAAARSSSKGAGSLSFSMNRLSTGIYSFLYASSINLEEKETLGTETISVTTIYYRIMQSIDDVKNETAFEQVFIDKAAYLKLKSAQAALVDRLAKNDITVDLWMELDTNFARAVAQAKATLDANQFKTQLRSAKTAVSMKSPDSTADQKLVQASIERLSAKKDTNKLAIEISKARLAEAYF